MLEDTPSFHFASNYGNSNLVVECEIFLVGNLVLFIYIYGSISENLPFCNYSLL